RLLACSSRLSWPILRGPGRQPGGAGGCATGSWTISWGDGAETSVTGGGPIMRRGLAWICEVGGLLLSRDDGRPTTGNWAGSRQGDAGGGASAPAEASRPPA